LQLPDELAESGVGYRAGQPAVADHSCDVEALHGDGAFGSREPRGELVQEVLAAVADAQVDLGDLEAGFGPVSRTGLGAVQGFVRPAQPTPGGFQRPGRVDLFDLAGIVGDDRERFQSEVDSAGRGVRADRAGGVDVRAVEYSINLRTRAVRVAMVSVFRNLVRCWVSQPSTMAAKTAAARSRWTTPTGISDAAEPCRKRPPSTLQSTQPNIVESVTGDRCLPRPNDLGRQTYLRLPDFDGVCDSALAAADLSALDDLGFASTLPAAEAAFEPVSRLFVAMFTTSSAD
jgi:hypothetical protein